MIQRRMHSIPVFFAIRLCSETFWTLTTLVFFDFVVKSALVCVQSPDAFGFILAYDPIFVDAVANIVIDLEMYEVYMVL